MTTHLKINFRPTRALSRVGAEFSWGQYKSSNHINNTAPNIVQELLKNLLKNHPLLVPHTTENRSAYPVEFACESYVERDG